MFCTLSKERVDPRKQKKKKNTGRRPQIEILQFKRIDKADIGKRIDTLSLLGTDRNEKEKTKRRGNHHGFFAVDNCLKSVSALQLLSGNANQSDYKGGVQTSHRLSHFVPCQFDGLST